MDRHCDTLRESDRRREADRRFRALLDGSPDATLLADPSGTILEANRAAARLFGIAREELIGLNQAALYPPQLAQHSDACFRRRGAQNAPTRWEHVVLRPDGTAVPVEIYAQRLSWCGVEVVALTVCDTASHGAGR